MFSWFGFKRGSRAQPVRPPHSAQTQAKSARSNYRGNYMMHGIAAGTRLATEHGWRDAGKIRVGDRVHTFDNGLQQVRAVTRGTHFMAGDDLPDFANPILVPARALGNEDALMLLPEQIVVIESDVAEEVTGDPFALVPAKALIGFRGIDRIHELRPVDVVTLHFETDEVIYAEGGALMLAPSSVPGQAMLDRLEEAENPTPYTIFHGETARALVVAMADEDARTFGSAAYAAAA
jgi:hypothetical protein